MKPPEWSLPLGVDSNLWEYLESSRLAEEESSFLQGDPLTITDEALLRSRFNQPGWMVDLGAGAGRLAFSFAIRGFHVVAVDLSLAMLSAISRDHEAVRHRIHPIRTNLCRLDGLPDGHFNLAVMMYSTLGMIHDRRWRVAALQEASRILRPGGRFAVHVHNYWLNLRDSGGRTWLFEELGRLVTGKPLGDRLMTYRGLPQIRIHLYRWNELKRDLRTAGFEIEELYPVHEVTARPLTRPWFLHQLRAGGWIVIARKS